MQTIISGSVRYCTVEYNPLKISIWKHRKLAISTSPQSRTNTEFTDEPNQHQFSLHLSLARPLPFPLARLTRVCAQKIAERSWTVRWFLLSRAKEAKGRRGEGRGACVTHCMTRSDWGYDGELCGDTDSLWGGGQYHTYHTYKRKPWDIQMAYLRKSG